MVADFGIAKLTEGQDHTQEGTMLGTAKYLAPEQVEGKAVDGRTDIYALGVVLFEMVTGQPPFNADTDAATALARLHHEAPRARSFRADVPHALDALLAKAMAQDPDERHADVAELRTELAAARSAKVDDSPPPPVVDSTIIEAAPDATPPAGIPAFVKSERSWLLPALLIVLVAVALGVAALLLGRNLGNELLNRGDDEPVAGGPLPIEVVSAEAFDPQGDGGENDAEAIETIDQDESTAWTTEGYNTQSFGNLKDGVGIILELDGTRTLDTVQILSPTTGWAAEIYVADEAGSSLADWGEPVGGGQDLDGDAELVVEGAEGSRVLVWITDLGDTQSAEFFRASIAEIVVTGE
ncbi:MAG: protein kinase [Actinomycetota bacterium]